MELHTFLLKFVNSNVFKTFIMTVILINTLTTAFYATFSKHPKKYAFELSVLEILDSVFLAIYTIEFVLKVSIRPRAFFYNGFNCFDFIVLVLSYFQIILLKAGSQNIGVFKVLRSVRALRPLRSVSFIGGLQVIVSALLATLRTSFLHVMTLLSVIMFVFSIMGYYMFGYDTAENQDEWGSFAKTALSLFVLVTAEGWPTIESNFYQSVPLPAMSWSRAYIILFLFIGHFVFSNLFVAVIIGQIDKATSQFEIKRVTKHKMDLEKRKRKVESQQSYDIKKMLASQKNHRESDKFRKVVIGRYQYLRSDEFTIITRARGARSSLWVRCFDQEMGILCEKSRGLQMTHREIVTNLAELITDAVEVDGVDDSNNDHILPYVPRRNGIQYGSVNPNMLIKCWWSCSTHFDQCTCAAADGHASSTPAPQRIEVKAASSTKHWRT